MVEYRLELDVVFGSGWAPDAAVESRQDAVVIAVDAIEIPVSCWRRRRGAARGSAEDIVLGELNWRRGGGGLGLQRPEESLGRPGVVLAAEARGGGGAANSFHLERLGNWGICVGVGGGYTEVGAGECK